MLVSFDFLSASLLPILPSLVPRFLHVAVLDSPLVDKFPVMLLFLVFASSIPAKPMSPPLPRQNRWWIDPVRVKMGIVIGVYMCQGVGICVLFHMFQNAFGPVLVLWSLKKKVIWLILGEY